MRKNSGVSLMAFSLWLLAASCNKELEINDYVDKVNKEYSRMFESGEYQLICKYKPLELLALEEMKTRLSKGEKITKEEWRAETEKFSNALYFDLTIGLKSKESMIKKNSDTQEKYTWLLSELTYNMARDFYMITDKDTLRAMTYNYSNTYGMGPDVQLLFAFAKNEKLTASQKLKLIYNDKLFGIGENVVFEYKTKELTEDLPKVKLN